MQIQPLEPVWPQRLATIDSQVVDIQFPRKVQVDQDAEWCEVHYADDREPQRVRFHDYHEIYNVPGFYEALFYGKLKCSSPLRVVSMLDEIMSERGEDLSDARVLDVGAGNGMVGDELAVRRAEKIVGIDIIEEARDAQRRDRPEVYDSYHVADLTDLPENIEERLRKDSFNCLTTVAALGFGDIPPAAFLKALDVTDTPAWLAFNIKEDFMRDEDESGFSGLIQKLIRRHLIEVEGYRRYSHRLSMAGKPLYYVAMIARKLEDVPDDLMERYIA